MPKRRPKHLIKRLGGPLTALLLLVLGVADWGVHQPRHWQQKQASRLPEALGEGALQLGNAVADLTDALGLTGHDVTAPLPPSFQTNHLLCAGPPKRLPNSPVPDDITVLNKTGFMVGYSPSLRHPVWVAYKVHPVAKPLLLPRPREFKPDLAARAAPTHKDYAKSGYDRGHMAPNLAISSRFGEAAQRQTFLTSNICPQRPSLNQGPWYNLEYRISELWPERYGTVWVITGALSPAKGRRLPSGIDIPSAFYQIVVTQKDDQLRAFASFMPQSIRRRAYTRTTLISIDELEALTGLDFLADLPDNVESILEASTPTRLWPVGPFGAAKLIYERTRKYD
jgi:endonuclease G